MAEALITQGIILHPSRLPAKIEADGDRRVLTMDDGQTLTTDLVFFATGPATPTSRASGWRRPASK